MQYSKNNLIKIFFAAFLGALTAALILLAVESKAASPTDSESSQKITQTAKAELITVDSEERKAKNDSLQQMFGGEADPQAQAETTALPKNPTDTKEDNAESKNDSALEKNDAQKNETVAESPSSIDTKATTSASEEANTPESQVSARQAHALTFDTAAITNPVPLMNDEQDKLARLRLLNLDVQIQEKERQLQELKNAITALQPQKPKKSNLTRSVRKKLPLPSVLSIQGIEDQLTATLRYSSTRQTKTVSKGDRIGKAKITKITPNSVVLSSGATLPFKE